MSSADFFAAAGFVHADLAAGPATVAAVRFRRSDAAARPIASPSRLPPSDSGEKDGREHEPVLCHLATALSVWCRDLRMDARPVLLRTGGLVHLATRLTGTAPRANSFDLLAALQYAQDYDERTVPSRMGINGQATYGHYGYGLMPYIKNTQVFLCPSAGAPSTW